MKYCWTVFYEYVDFTSRPAFRSVFMVTLVVWLGLYSHGEESTMTLRQCHSGRHKKLRITFLKNVCSDPSFAREINYTVRDGKCHWSLSKWPISRHRAVTSLHMKSSQPSLANSACTTRVKYPTKSGRVSIFILLQSGPDINNSLYKKFGY